MILKVLKDEDGKTLQVSSPVPIQEHPSMPQLPREQAARSRRGRSESQRSSTLSPLFSSSACSEQKRWAMVRVTTKAQLFQNFVNQADYFLRFLSCTYSNWKTLLCEYCFRKEEKIWWRRIINCWDFSV